MKIAGNNLSTNAYVNQVKGKNKVGAQSRQTFKSVISKDRVELSQVATEIRHAKQFLSSLPDVREEKVAELKKQIDNGTYTPDEEKIAADMIKESILNELL